MSVKFDPTKTYSYLKGLAMGLGFKDSVKALAFARDSHKGQYRKNGEEYIIHPLTVASHAVALGMKEDDIIAVSLLHDVVEDCGVSVKDLPISANPKNSVRLLTHIKNVPLDVYYKDISEDKVASIVKLLDRCNNVSTMAGAFTNKKIKSYIQETQDFVLPLLENSKEKWPEYSDIFFILKYHIKSMIDGLEICLPSDKIKTFSFPPFEEWYKTKLYEQQLGDYTCQIKNSFWGSDVDGYMAVISNPSGNPYENRLFLESIECNQSDKDNLKKWYESATIHLNKKFEEFIKETYINM